jgi:hypothetical protein
LPGAHREGANHPADAGAITLLRQPDDRYIPDAHRAMAAQPALAFALLGGYDEHFEKP